MKRILAIVVILLPLFVFAGEKIKTEEKVKTVEKVETVGYLGISGDKLSEAMKTALGLDYGVLIEKVYEDSPAEEADIKIGDVILKIDKEKVEDFDALNDIIEERPNKKVDIIIYRTKKQITKKVELAEREKKRLKIDIDIPDFS